MNQTLVETSRIRVVSLDLEAVIAALENRPRFESMLESSVDPDWPLNDMKDLLGFVRTKLASRSETSIWGGVIVRKSPNIVIGDIGFHSSPVNGQVEIGYSIVAAYRNMGYATEAAREFLRWGFQHPDITEVIARVDVQNKPSETVLRKIGFEFESSSEDCRRYRITRTLLH